MARFTENRRAAGDGTMPTSHQHEEPPHLDSGVHCALSFCPFCLSGTASLDGLTA